MTADEFDVLEVPRGLLQAIGKYMIEQRPMAEVEGFVIGLRQVRVRDKRTSRAIHTNGEIKLDPPEPS